jgi:hypothetical protein
MPRAQQTPTHTVYQIKVTLKGNKPPIWRRIQVTSETTLAKLHRILQRVMGWEDSHLHQFIIGSMVYGDPGMLGELDAKDARTVWTWSHDRGSSAPSVLSARAPVHQVYSLTIEHVFSGVWCEVYP